MSITELHPGDRVRIGSDLGDVRQTLDATVATVGAGGFWTPGGVWVAVRGEYTVEVAR